MLIASFGGDSLEEMSDFIVLGPFYSKVKLASLCICMGKKHLKILFSETKDALWVVGWCEGVMYLLSPGHPLILAYSWARPAILVAGKGREVTFLFLLFLHFHSCSSFFPVPPFYLFCYLFCLFSPFLWETTQNDQQGLTCR